MITIHCWLQMTGDEQRPHPLHCVKTVALFFTVKMSEKPHQAFSLCNYGLSLLDKSLATIGPPAKRHFNGVSLAGQELPYFISV